jgi:hypothetical protein
VTHPVIFPICKLAVCNFFNFVYVCFDSPQSEYVIDASPPPADIYYVPALFKLKGANGILSQLEGQSKSSM